MSVKAYREVKRVYSRSGHYEWHLVVENGRELESEAPGEGVAAVDPGEIHPLTLTDGEETGGITAAELRAIFEWQNKKLAEIQHCEASPYGGKQAAKVGGSRGWQRLQQAKTAREIRDKVSRAAVEWVCERQVG
jgi:putative transposase